MSEDTELVHELKRIRQNLEYIGSNLEQIYYVLRDGKGADENARRDTD